MSPTQTKNQKMNIIEALKTAKANGITTVRNTNHDTYDIDDLIDVVESCDNLEDTSDRGEWCVDGDGIEQLDDNGYRTGNTYTSVE